MGPGRDWKQMQRRAWGLEDKGSRAEVRELGPGGQRAAGSEGQALEPLQPLTSWPDMVPVGPLRRPSPPNHDCHR